MKKENVNFQMNKAGVVGENPEDCEILLVACGEMVKPCVDAAKALNEKGIKTTVLDMYCVKPLDKEAIIKYAAKAKAVVTVEEHSPFGGLGSMVSQVVASRMPEEGYQHGITGCTCYHRNIQRSF